jgi:phenylacetate-CoA ligase
MKATLMTGKKYLDEKLECMSRGELRKLQLERLKDLFHRARKKCGFYKEFLEEHGAQNVQIKGLEDIQKIPLMSKKDSRQAYPDKLLLVPRERIKQIHGSSGTTGKSTLVFATPKDMTLWAERNGRTFWAVGFRPGDYFLKVGGYGLAAGAFGFHYGAQYIKVCVIPTGIGKAQQKIELMEDLKVAGIGGSPTFMAYMAQLAAEKGMKFHEKPYPRIALFGGQPTSTSTRNKLESLFGLNAYDEYGMTELLGPGMACECERREGMHVWSDHIFVECINPKTGEWVREGEEGELVWTFLASEAAAVIRYQSGDLSRIISEPCGCGRTHVRIASVKGRIDDGVSIGGFTVFPSQVEEVLFGFKEAGSNFRCIVDSDEKGLDRLAVDLEVSERSLLDDEKKKADLTIRLKDRLQDVLGVTPRQINFVEPYSLPTDATGDQSKTGNIRMIDKRKWD